MVTVIICTYGASILNLIIADQVKKREFIAGVLPHTTTTLVGNGRGRCRIPLKLAAMFFDRGTNFFLLGAERPPHGAADPHPGKPMGEPGGGRIDFHF